MTKQYKIWAPLVIMWLVTAGHAVAEDRFDLICNVRETESFHPGQVSSYERHITIDLAAGDFCIWDRPSCNKIHKIKHVTENEIRLFDADNSFMFLKTSVNRKTWMWTSKAHIKEFIRSGGESHGPCKQAPFMPFPSSAKRMPE